MNVDAAAHFIVFAVIVAALFTMAQTERGREFLLALFETLIGPILGCIGLALAAVVVWGFYRVWIFWGPNR